MLKLGKGLGGAGGKKKGKKKGKKGKKGEDDDLFDPKELEEYRRRQQEKKQQLEQGLVEEEYRERSRASTPLPDGEPSASGDEAAAAASGDSSAAAAPDDEWKRFAALTAGVDDVLRRTGQDLRRIQSTSYFQRKPPPSELKKQQEAAAEGKAAAGEKKEGGAQPAATGVPASQQQAGPTSRRWVGFDERTGQVFEPEPEPQPQPQAELESEEHKEEEEAEEHKESSESEEEYPEEDDLFDTSYVAALASGEVRLAYVPDSPEEEAVEGEDPFDTSIAEPVVKALEEEQRRKPKVSLGANVVDVLAGRAAPGPGAAAASSTGTPGARRRQRRVPRDLLLGSFDEGGDVPVSIPGADSAAVAAPAAPEPPPPKSLLDDDDVLGFAPDTEVNLDGPVVASAAVPITATAASRPTSPQPSALQDLVAEFDIIGGATAEAEVQPSLAAAVDPLATTVGGELVSLTGEPEDELEDEFAALAQESAAKAPPPPPAGVVAEDLDVEEDDPFDTRVAAAVLGEEPSVAAAPSPPPPQDPFALDDDELAALPPVGTAGGRPPFARPAPSPDVDVLLRSEAPPLVAPAAARSHWAAFDDEEQLVQNPEALLAEEEGEGHEPDPFDTSIAEGLLPGKAELKIIEKEILSDLDSVPFGPAPNVQNTPTTVCIRLTDPSGIDQHPQHHLEEEPVVEDELRPLTPSHRDLLGGSTPDLARLAQEPLAPAGGAPEDDADALAEAVAARFSDPFDTSACCVPAPGKAELRRLEEELFASAQEEAAAAAAASTLNRSLSDPDFDPRGAQDDAQLAGAPPRPDILNVQANKDKSVAFELPTPSGRPDLLVLEAGARAAQPLTPYYAPPGTAPPPDAGETSDNPEEEQDPFDTSFANLPPGRAELRLLESELVSAAPAPIPAPVQLPPAVAAATAAAAAAAAEAERLLSDPYFDPRGEPSPPTIGPPSPPQPQQGAVPAATGGRRRSDASADRPAWLPLRRPTLPAVLPAGVAAALASGAAHPHRANPLPVLAAPAPDLLRVEEEETPVALLRPLSPAVDQPSSPDIAAYSDPFDTSIADRLPVGRAELRLLESELVGEPRVLDELCDPEFDPRAPSPRPPPAAASTHPQPSFPAPDLLDLPAEGGARPLTPAEVAAEEALEEAERDPFDTSIAEALVPGKAELRVIESEILGQ